MKLGIMSAMHEEVALLQEKLGMTPSEEIAGREYLNARLNNHEIVLTHSKWGKVASAISATTLIHRFNVDAILFTGVAGSVSPFVNIGDIVISSKLYQHDMDARPFFQKHVIPLIDKKFFNANAKLIELATHSAQKFIAAIDQHVSREDIETFSLQEASAHLGVIASGDKFVGSVTEAQSILNETPEALAVEMEGASVAQVCDEHKIPFVIIRTISDNADKQASKDFQRFIKNIASVYSHGILHDLIATSEIDLS